MAKKEVTNLSWDAFQSLGNPDNAPKMEEEVDQLSSNHGAVVRIHLEKKQRGGKVATLVKGLEDVSSEVLTSYIKELRKICGVGGNEKNGELLLQGNQREKVQEYLVAKGYSNVKLAGG